MTRMKSVLKDRETTSFIFLAALFLLVGVINPSFLTVGNISACFNTSVVYTLVAVGVSVLLFLLLYVRRSFRESRAATAYDRVMALFDAAGLGIFTVSGIHTARSLGFDQTFLLVFLGVITGVGGGLLRDVIAQEKPYILTKHVYACASIAGALVCVWVYPALGSPAAMAAGALAVFLVRLLAMRYRWNLPRIR